MDHPTHAVPEFTPTAARPHDPLAVALGNASLLGVGYLLLGRRNLAVITGLVTVVLVCVAASAARPWCEVVVLLWWTVVIAHGWFLAGGRKQRVAAHRQRLVALGATVAVLLTVALLRLDASGIERSVAQAREDGDCARVLTTQRRVWFGHRVAAAPLAARGDDAVQACHRLRTAKAKLTTGLTGDTGALKAGFDTLASVLAEPGNRKAVEVVLEGFLGSLPTKNPCQTAVVTDWLSHRQPSRNALDRSADTVQRTEPSALVECGDDLMAAMEWHDARARYQQLLDRYPGAELTGKARDGVRQATLSIELANVHRLLEETDDTQPEYCSAPAKYSGAAPYRKGTNRALFYGNDEYTGKLPARWRASDAEDAVLVVCADEADYGTPVQTCHYENKTFPRFPRKVTFHKIAIRVKVYELRTGKRVADRKLQISGTSCPRVLRYTTYGPTDLGPDGDQYVKASKADIRAAFSPLVNR